MSLKGDYIRYEISKYRTSLRYGFYFLNLFFGIPYLIVRLFGYNKKFNQVEQLFSNNLDYIESQDLSPEISTFAFKYALRRVSKKRDYLNNLFNKLLENKEDIIWQDINSSLKGEALEKAAEKGYSDLVKEIITNPNFMYGIKSYSKYLAFMEAIRKDHSEIVKAMITNPDFIASIDPSHKDELLKAAVKTGYLDIKKAIIISPNLLASIQHYDKDSILKAVAEQGHFDIVQSMITNPDFVGNISDWTKGEILEATAKKGHLDIMNLLLDNTTFALKSYEIYRALDALLLSGKLYEMITLAQERMCICTNILDKYKLNGKMIFNILDVYKYNQLEEVINYLNKYNTSDKIIVENLKQKAEKALKEDDIILHEYIEAGKLNFQQENRNYAIMFNLISKKPIYSNKRRDQATNEMGLSSDIENLIGEFMLGSSKIESFGGWAERVNRIKKQSEENIEISA